MGDQNIVSTSGSSPPEKNSPAADQFTCSTTHCTIYPDGSLRPIGYRFKPTDAQLISDFLSKKIRGQQLESNDIQEVNLRDFTYADLTEKYKEYGVFGAEWYVFTTRERRHPKGGLPRRDAGNNEGYWKATGKFEPIEDEHKIVIGTKRTLVYQILNKNSSTKKSTNTDLKMVEYVVVDAEIAAVPDTNMECATDTVKPFTDICLCRIYKKPSKSTGNSASLTDGDAQEMEFIDPFPWFGNNLSVEEENEHWEMELKEENQTNSYFNELPDMNQNDPDFWDFDGRHLLTDEQLSFIRCDRINSPVTAQHQQQPQQQRHPQQQQQWSQQQPTQQQWRPQQQLQQQWLQQQQTQQQWRPQQQRQQQWSQQQPTQQQWRPQQQRQQQWSQQQLTQQQWRPQQQLQQQWLQQQQTQQQWHQQQQTQQHWHPQQQTQQQWHQQQQPQQQRQQHKQQCK